ncbi:hypothetical protein GCM10010172_87190 [Paractinoplanes ferrugineus]|uniref:Uncharacterized protein n=1 Tax=Paractinoplanes ferrugineus TaxID=113564 RepID=A0A919J8I2_9ACTN|nr:hypothetical protein [Actinoplanes ferrugineus]GIE15509.1 hypothetical protein Afe05nite_73490 [Actinoplanes ferrugineus]
MAYPAERAVRNGADLDFRNRGGLDRDDRYRREGAGQVRRMPPAAEEFTADDLTARPMSSAAMTAASNLITAAGAGPYPLIVLPAPPVPRSVHFACSGRPRLTETTIDRSGGTMFTTRVARIIAGVAVASAASAVMVAGGPASASPSTATVAVRDLGARPDLACARVKSPTQPQVYVIDPEGYRRWIPNPATYESLFRSWEGIVVSLETNQIAERAPLDDGAFLGKAESQPHVYLVSNGMKRWIINMGVFDKGWFTGARMKTLPDAAMAAIPTGPYWSC